MECALRALGYECSQLNVGVSQRRTTGSPTKLTQVSHRWRPTARTFNPLEDAREALGDNDLLVGDGERSHSSCRVSNCVFPPHRPCTFRR